MALGADRYTSRVDTLVFLGCLGLSLTAMSLPPAWRDPHARRMRPSIVVAGATLEFRASGMAADGSVYGIVAPHGTEGPGVWLLELQGVPYRQLVPVGTPIFTSGLGGVFPRGIPLGTVIGVAGETEGWERTYLVRPAVHPSAVTHVMILNSGRSAGGLHGAFRADSVPAGAGAPAGAQRSI